MNQATTEHLTEDRYRARRAELEEQLREARAVNAKAEKAACEIAIDDKDLLQTRTAVELLQARIRGLDAVRAEAEEAEEAEQAELQKRLAIAAAEEVKKLAPLIVSQLRNVKKALDALDTSAAEYDRLMREVSSIAKPFKVTVHGIESRGAEARLCYEMLSGSRLDAWGVSKVPDWNHAIVARAVGEPRSTAAPSIDELIQDRSEQLNEIADRMTGEGR